MSGERLQDHWSSGLLLLVHVLLYLCVCVGGGAAGGAECEEAKRLILCFSHLCKYSSMLS